MRAIYLKENFDNQKLVTLNGDIAHHLNVVRVKLNDEILILNGLGKSAEAIIISISKKEIIIEIKEVINHQQKHQISLAIALPKKDAFEDILKMATELGVNEIYPLVSDFSQYSFKQSERIDRLIESALIQSNNMFAPIIHPEQKLDLFLENNKSPLVYFSSRPLKDKLSLAKNVKCIILIGPEGGFSSDEESKILEMPNVNQIHLQTPILRAPTAVATSIGYLLSN